MQNPLFSHVAILGLGLIGASLAKTLASKKLGTTISVFDTSPEAQLYAAGAGWKADYAHAGQAVENADLIVFAAPPAAFEALAKDIAPFLKQGAVVMDVASVKRHAVATIAPHLPAYVAFVPAHPIAGSEKTGAAASRDDLFKGKQVILTPKKQDLKSVPVTRIRTLWETLGAKIEYMPAELHDRIYAYVSHLPQVVSFASGKCLKGIPAETDETFTRFMRLTHSDPALWADICVLNADFIREALAAFTSFAGQMTGELSQSQEEGNGNGHIAPQLLPMIVATCLVATASLLQEDSGIHPAHFAGAGFSDMVSPATQDPHAALAAISEHHHHIAHLLASFLRILHEMSDALSAGDKNKLQKLFR